MQRHQGDIKTIVSNDRFAATGGADSGICLYSSQNLDFISNLGRHDGPVFSLDFLTDSVLLSGSADKTVRVWDNLTSRRSRSVVLRGHTSDVLCVQRLSYTTLSSGDMSGDIFIWSLENEPRSTHRVAAAHAGAVSDLDSHSNVLYSCSFDGTVKLWDPRTASQQHRLQTRFPFGLYSLKICPVSRKLAIGGDSAIDTFDLSNLTTPSALTGHSGRVLDLQVVSPNTLISTCSDRSIFIWDLRQSSRIDSIEEAHTTWINAVTVLPNGKIATVSDDSTLKTWDLRSVRAAVAENRRTEISRTRRAKKRKKKLTDGLVGTDSGAEVLRRVDTTEETGFHPENAPTEERRNTDSVRTRLRIGGRKRKRSEMEASGTGSHSNPNHIRVEENDIRPAKRRRIQ